MAADARVVAVPVAAVMAAVVVPAAATAAVVLVAVMAAVVVPAAAMVAVEVTAVVVATAVAVATTNPLVSLKNSRPGFPGRIALISDFRDFQPVDAFRRAHFDLVAFLGLEQCLGNG